MPPGVGRLCYRNEEQSIFSKFGQGLIRATWHGVPKEANTHADEIYEPEPRTTSFG